MKIRYTLMFVVGLLHALGVVAQTQWRANGKQSFVFSAANGLKMKPIQVWMYSPTNRPDTLPIVMMMHGAERNASAYLDQWVATADLFKLVIIAPTFSKEDYKGNTRYNMGNVYNEQSGSMNPVNEWTFSIIEPLFEYVRNQIGSTQVGYYLSGHSAGAQFVHRFLYFVPENKVIQAVAANAGWYTLPAMETDFPFGLKQTPVNSEVLKKIYHKKVFIVLGEADTDTTSSNFQKDPAHNLQGLNRLERGKYFFSQSKAMANQLQTNYHWSLITVPGVGHSNKEIAKIAAALFTMNIVK